RRATPLTAAGLAWLAGFAMFLAGTWWWVALGREFAGLGPVAAVALAALFAGYQALPYGLAAASTAFLGQRYQLPPLLVGPLCLGLAEALLPFFFKTSLAIVLWQVRPLAQTAELGGPPAVAALLVLVNLTLGSLLVSLLERRSLPPASRRAAVLCLALTALGWGRAWQVEQRRLQAPRLSCGIVQPNFGVVAAQERRLHNERFIAALRAATQELGRRGVDLILWPESAWPLLFDRTLTREFAAGHPWELRPGVRGRLLLGALTHQFGGTTVCNSALLFADDRRLAGRYDKTRLVPFAEAIPLASRFPDWAKRLRTRLPDWPAITPGPALTLLQDGDVAIGAMICAEDLDSLLAQRLARLRPNLLVSLASDAWFGASSAPVQHLALASFRAIETRRDLVRATNTGVSAIIDATGRKQLTGPLLAVPRNQPAPPTLLQGEVRLLNIPSCGRHGVRFFPLAAALILGALLASRILGLGRGALEHRQRSLWMGGPQPHILQSGLGAGQIPEQSQDVWQPFAKILGNDVPGDQEKRTDENLALEVLIRPAGQVDKRGPPRRPARW
ncbi:MAG: apolipoprotein N-acyltransferase, partial [Thermodesulfobacteriota bacterium]